MSTFSCPIVDFKLETHPNATLLSIATIKGWQAVIKTSEFENETLGVYIPMDSIAPKDHPLLGFLEGKRVKICKLRGSVSQGILLPFNKVKNYLQTKKIDITNFKIGTDLSKELEIKKWEEPIRPEKLSTGGVQYAELSRPEWSEKYTDIENWNNYPDIIKEGELVSLSEKLHGCLSHFDLIDGIPYIFSRNRCLRIDDKIIRVPTVNKYIYNLFKKLNLTNLVSKNKVIPPEDTVWHRIYSQYVMYGKLLRLADILNETNVSIYGEIIGTQDLLYGLNKGNIDFRVFDIRTGARGYLPPEETIKLAKELKLEHVPILYVGPFKKELLELRHGTTTIMKEKAHVREGVVIKPLIPRMDRSLGRVILKKVSEEYLMRRNSTDY